MPRNDAALAAKGAETIVNQVGAAIATLDAKLQQADLLLNPGSSPHRQEQFSRLVAAAVKTELRFAEWARRPWPTPKLSLGPKVRVRKK